MPASVRQMDLGMKKNIGFEILCRKMESYKGLSQKKNRAIVEGV